MFLALKEPLDEEEVLEPERQVPSQSTDQPMELMVQTKEAKETSPSEKQSPGAADTAIESIAQKFEGTATFVKEGGIPRTEKPKKKHNGVRS
ncbi:Protein CBG28060 [Caenorhabditis briggsae]|uniref:Uncharacterized protein n=2 Tax=Caenorhabditis briggsae TaxID=6238 RepID=A0AAE9A194_CAEBR|nr:Protein CBG28060 [Caenorhabditis briggsae]ULT84723.1 hypothetical protein L3Y34_013412 [Caenorhabditis briggsae]CAR99080.1 Protein CBG28060 [Caenorhabditis briggsae]